MASAAPLVLDGVVLTLPSAAGPVEILRGVDLVVAPGETVAIVGPSGSGKSSLISIAAGLETPTRGRAMLFGQDMAALGEDGRARLRRGRAALVFQSFHLLPNMTAEENVSAPLELAHRPGAVALARSWLERVGLGARRSHYPHQMSGGEQQRVALARAFVAEPAILLADEPTGNPDQATGESVMDALFDMHRRIGTTLILVTHEKRVADRCERLLSLADGLIAGDETRVQQVLAGAIA
jgi:putative ABC transport system ATP-binding protein